MTTMTARSTSSEQTMIAMECVTLEDYLDMMMDEYQNSESPCLFLPSLMSLAEYFNCSAVEVHMALNDLKTDDCDFFIMNFDSPITLWFPQRLEDGSRY